jgi:streptogramin lyase
VVLVIDDFETATALREALDEEAARHQFAADSWPVVARQLSLRPSWRTRVSQLAPAVASLAIVAAIAIVVIAGRPGTSRSVGGPQVQRHHSWLAKDGVLSFSGTGQGIAGVAAGHGVIWVGGLGVTYRVDPATDRIVDTILTPKAGRFSQVATGLGSVWVSGGDAAGTGLGIYRIDPRRDRVTAFIPLPGSGRPAAVAAAYGSVWATSTAHGGSVLRIDPKTDQVAGQPIQVNASVPGGIVAGSRRLWVNAAGFDAPVTAIDPATGTVIRRAALAKISDVSTTGDGSLWTIGKNSVQRVNPATGKIIASVPLAMPSQIVFVHGIAVVITLRLAKVKPPFDVTSFYWHTAICIDPATNKPACRPVQLGGLPIVLTAAPNGLWSTNLSFRTLTRYTVTPPRN